MEDYSFPRYLASKKSVDDRALNYRVWKRFLDQLEAFPPQATLRVLEAGAGIGAMLEKLLSSGLLRDVHYTAVDEQPDNLRHARSWLYRWAADHGYRLEENQGEMLLARRDERVAVEFILADVFDFAERTGGSRQWEVLIAHAFLDLTSLPQSLMKLFGLLSGGGLFYFPINFDGLTVFEPEIDPRLDAQILRLYHATMDQRQIRGGPSGDSRTGRRLFQHLSAAGGQVLEAGSSDWVVYPQANGYPADEAYFLHFIVHTIYQALRNHPELGAKAFEDWIAARHEQIARGELIYVAHQLDFVGRVVANPSFR